MVDKLSGQVKVNKLAGRWTGVAIAHLWYHPHIQIWGLPVSKLPEMLRMASVLKPITGLPSWFTQTNG